MDKFIEGRYGGFEKATLDGFQWQQGKILFRGAKVPKCEACEKSLAEAGIMVAGLTCKCGLQYHVRSFSGLDKPTKGVLSTKGVRAAATIAAFLETHKLDDTGGCTTFYTPEEWKARGEKYGESSHLIVVYDGGDLHSIIDEEFGGELLAKLTQALDDIGVYMEACTNWYSAVYSKHQ